MTMATIEAQAEGYAALRQELSFQVGELDAELHRLKARRLPKIRTLFSRCANARALLEMAVDEDRGLFEKPRSRVFAGIRVGLEKGKGKISWAKPGAVVARIRRLMPDRFDDLVVTTEKPSKQALGRLTAAELKKLGVDVGNAGDRIVVKPQDSAIDKLVDALLADGAEAEEAPDRGPGQAREEAA